jgi:hypothetical protein
VQRREDQLFVGLPQVSRLRHALLHIGKFLPQLRQLHTHLVRLLVEQHERLFCVDVLSSSYCIGGLRVVEVRHL